jgi:hypothetical protein
LLHDRSDIQTIGTELKQEPGPQYMTNCLFNLILYT